MSQETKLGLAACAVLLGLPLKRLRAAARSGQFPDPAGYGDGQPYWLDAHAYGWALSAAPEAAGRVPLWWWPDAAEPAVFSGPRDIGGGDVALGWEVAGLGEVFMAWPSHDTLGGSDRIVGALRDAVGIVVVEADFSPIGPSVRGILPAVPGVEEYPMLDWRRVAEVIGAPAALLALCPAHPRADPGVEARGAACHGVGRAGPGRAPAAAGWPLPSRTAAPLSGSW